VTDSDTVMTGDQVSTCIDLIRHGEPVGGTRYRGQTDDPLSERGWRQMWDAVGEGHGWQHIVTSPLLRCSAFAHACGARLRLPVSEDPRLEEMGLGAWEGRTRAELVAHDPAQVGDFYRDPVAGRPPGAEPLEAFVARVWTAFDEMLLAYRGRAVLVVAHAGVIRAVLARVLDLPLTSLYRIRVANAAVTRIVREDGGAPYVVFHGLPAGGLSDVQCVRVPA
jgi:alpha-ribazole phosphatase